MEQRATINTPGWAGRPRTRLASGLIFGALLLGAIVVIFPIIWMALGSFKDLAESNRFPPTFLPETWHPGNYVDAWRTPPSTLGRYFVNSVVLAVVGTALHLVICVLAAYAFARLRFAGSDPLFLLVLATTMVPNEVTLIPNFVTIRHVPLAGGNDLLGQGGSGLYDSYAAMLLPGLAGAFTVFLLRQAFRQVPNDLWEAAQLDGERSWGFLWRILLPLTLPALLTVVIFGYVGRWNALLWPLIVTRSEEMRPIQVAMIYFQNEFGNNWGLVMAAAVMAVLPVMLLYAIVQKQFIAGVATTGLIG